jgi:hypothetical protein
MNALQLKDGKFWLVPDVPKKPDYASIQYEYKKKFAYSEYERAKEQALSNSIEVAEESVELALGIIVNSTPKNVFTKTGDLITGVKEWLYPIEGLTYRVEERGIFEETYPNGSHKGVKVLKQVAIINE